MCRNRRCTVLIIAGFLVLLASVFIFALSCDHPVEGTDLLGFGFIIFSELVFFGGLTAIEALSRYGSAIIIRTGCVFCVCVYSILAFVSALLFMLLMGSAQIKAFLIFQIIIFTVALIAGLMYFMAARSVKENDVKQLKAAEQMDILANLLSVLKARYPIYEQQLLELSEQLRFMDHSYVTEVDSELKMQIKKLESDLKNDSSEEEIIRDFSVVSDLIDRRKVYIQSMKMGGC